MIKSINGKTPKIADSAYVSEAAYVVGDVEIGEHSNVWPGAVIRADFGRIKIGDYVAIEDNCCLHADLPMTIGDDCIVGHGAVLHGSRLGCKVLVGMNATILDRSEIGDYCIIGAGTVITEGMKIPPYSLVLGVPAKIKGDTTEQMKAWKGHLNIYPDLAKRYKSEKL